MRDNPAPSVVCQHGDFCMAVCEDHWGDCNDDHRDGCEQPIEHRVYCKGDPRIREYNPATIDLYQDAHSGPGVLDAAGFDRLLERSKSTLQSCYDRALQQDAKLEVTLRYRFSIDEGTRPAHSASDRRGTAKRPARELRRQLDIEHPPSRISEEWTCHIRLSHSICAQPSRRRLGYKLGTTSTRRAFDTGRPRQPNRNHRNPVIRR
jgi:hypothetical protein